jgi:Phosphoribosylamine-glycine ligase
VCRVHFRLELFALLLMGCVQTSLFFSQVSKIYIAPGNIGASFVSKVENVSIDLKNFTAVAEWSRENEINLVVIGPEDPLANGITDVLTSHGIPCFGPTKAAARIEADKNWSKQFMDKYLIPTAKWKSFTEAKEATAFIEK